MSIQVALGNGRGQTLLKVPIYEKQLNGDNQLRRKTSGCELEEERHTFSSMLRRRGLKTAVALNMLQQKERKWNISVKDDQDNLAPLFYSGLEAHQKKAPHHTGK